MIWSVVLKSEMEGFGTAPVFRHYQEAIGKENIKLAVVEENDPLDFVKDNDIVLLRSSNKSIINTIKRKNVASTAEDYHNYEHVKDKTALPITLSIRNIRTPRQYEFRETLDGHAYFVKPRFGSDSFGISAHSLCSSKRFVSRQFWRIKDELKQDAVIEDFIDGVDCTVACWTDKYTIHTCAIEVECPDTNGIQTRECKVGFLECCSALHDKNIEDIAKEVFQLLKLKSHARIDFRRGKDGLYYLIDVNLIPGLGPLDHFAKCLLLCKNMSYTDAVKAVIGSAKR